MDNELFDFWTSSIGELGDVLIMEDGAGRQEGVATKRRKEYERGRAGGNLTHGRLILQTWTQLRSSGTNDLCRFKMKVKMKKEYLAEAITEEWEKLAMAWWISW